jgi:hypothetical protein
MRKPTSTIVISGDALQYVQNRELRADDYAVVVPRLLHSSHGFVRGVALDSRGCRSRFSMPIERFFELKLSESPANEVGQGNVQSAA